MGFFAVSLTTLPNITGVDILQIGPFFSPTSNWGVHFLPGTFPEVFTPTPHFKCKTHQIWPTLKWNYSFFINFYFFFKKSKKLVHEEHFLP